MCWSCRGILRVRGQGQILTSWRMMSCRDPTPETSECHYCQRRRWCQPSPRMTESPPQICLTFPETIIFFVNMDLIEKLALQYVWGDFKNIKYGFWLYNGRDVAQMIYVILPEKRWPFADCLMVKSSSRPIDFFSQFDLTILIFSLSSSPRCRPLVTREG